MILAIIPDKAEPLSPSNLNHTKNFRFQTAKATYNKRLIQIPIAFRRTHEPQAKSHRHRRPSASGKGTVASRVAEALGFLYLDSGALYRLTALYAQKQNVAWTDEDAVSTLGRNFARTI